MKRPCRFATLFMGFLEPYEVLWICGFVFMTVLELFILWLSGWLANSVSDDIHNAVSFE